MNKMTRVPKILQVGVGRWGVNHLRVWTKLHAEGACRLIGVVDKDPERRKAIGDEFGVRMFSDFSAIEEADAVDIVVPTYQHLEIMKIAIAAGKDFLVEKPVTQDMKEARELEKLTRGSKAVMMVGHLFRYNPAADLVRSYIELKEIGKIRFMRGRFMGFRFQEHDAGILATTAIHFIYLSNFFHGRMPIAVRARVDYALGTKLDDFCQLRLDYDGPFTVLESDYFTPGKWRSFDVIGTQGSAQADLLTQKVELHRKRHVKGKDRYEIYDAGVIKPDIKFQEPLDLELRHFLQCVRDRSQPMTGLREGIEVLKIIEAAYESSRRDKTVLITGGKNALPSLLER